jgi:Mn2+/Fe2+ NRAMP family transporter
MIVVIVTFAATIYATHHQPSLITVGQLASALAPRLGPEASRVLIGAAVLGGALVAAIVISLAGSWGIAEVPGWQHSLNRRLSRTNWRFYLVYALAHIAGAIIVLAGVNLVSLAVDVEVMNTLLLPIAPARA